MSKLAGFWKKLKTLIYRRSPKYIVTHEPNRDWNFVLDSRFKVLHY